MADPTLDDPILEEPTLNDPTLDDPTLNNPTLNAREQESLDHLLDRLEKAGPHAIDEKLVPKTIHTVFRARWDFTNILLKEALIYVICRLRKAVDDMLEFASIAAKQHPKINAGYWQAQGGFYKRVSEGAGFGKGMSIDDFGRDVRRTPTTDAGELKRAIVNYSALAIVAENAAGRLATAICVAQGDIDA